MTAAQRARDDESVSGVSTRNREETDLPQCVEALAEVHDIDRYPIVWPEHPAQWISPSGLLRAWVAEQDRKVVGHIALVDECDLPEGSEPGCGPPLALISRLYVTPSARRQAAGAQLLNHAQTWAMAEGYSLMLEVAELGDHAAIALYERSGWHHVSSATASWTTPEGRPVTLRYYKAPA
jgi:GNAT superfamily N-acetyltransferase